MWLNKEGLPLSWAHFVYGLASAGRDRAKESIREFRVFAVANAADQKSREEWLNEQKTHAGW
jgi:hypothetical protein